MAKWNSRGDNDNDMSQTHLSLGNINIQQHRNDWGEVSTPESHLRTRDCSPHLALLWAGAIFSAYSLNLILLSVQYRTGQNSIFSVAALTITLTRP